MFFFVILAYNEEQNLSRLLTSIKTHAPLLGQPYTVVLVDDGSTDGTRALVREFQQTMPLQIEKHPRNLGVGQGFRTGFSAVLSVAQDDDVIITLEADNTGDLSILQEMKRKIGAGADVVLASCYARGGGMRGVSLQRRFMSSGINTLLRILFPIKRGHTYSSFYRAYRSGVLKEVMERYGERFIRTPGFGSAAEILLKLRRHGARVDEIPMVVLFDERKGKSKMKVWATIIQYLGLLVREIKMEIQHKSGRA